nr:PREDICTED: LIM and calponin homology domains-containing protein 1 isoform X4 [Latimeria chalumnae]|eukprot:XP_014346232.1 PREDICTED: LIM and calponin homology domains-containing protein 1 isoform X4 [Latimeria chalumnae]
MASPGLQLEENHHQQDSVLELAFNEAQKWIEQVTGRSFGDKDFRSGLENGILLCELLNAIKPGLVKKINRLPTPIAGLDNISLFLRGCKELGLKESQLFDPSDLQDTSHRLGVRSPDCSRKLKNVLITIYWLGKVANSCASYNGATLNLKEFEGLLAQIKKETEEVDSPKRSIRDSGYIDCWDSERSDSLSPPRHGRDDSFDSLDSFGSRSQQTPSPDVILKGSSDGRGSDSESDMPHRKMLDSRKDDMSARRTSYSEPKTAVPFNQYLPNKSNQTCYMPASLRKKKAEREEYRKSWSTATSPLGGERPFSQNPPETIEEEQYEATLQYEEEGAKHKISKIETSEQVVKFKLDSDLPKGDLRDQSPSDRSNKTLTQKWEGKDEEEIRKLQRLEQAGIKVMPASKRYSSVHQKQTSEEPTTLDIILRRENAFLMYYQGNDLESDEEEHRVPDVEKDDLATRKARMSQFTPKVAFNQFLPVTCTKQDREKWEAIKLASQRAVGSPQKNQRDNRSENQVQASDPTDITRKQNSFFKSHRNDSEKEGEEQQQQVKVPDVLRDDLAKRKAQSSLAIRQELPLFIKGSVTQADLEKWEKLKMSTETSDENSKPRKIGCEVKALPKIEAETAAQNDLASRKARANKKAPGAKQRFVHFGPVTEIDQKRWDKLSIAKAGSEGETEEASSGGAKAYSCGASSVVSQANACSSQHGRREDRLPASHNDSSTSAYLAKPECYQRWPSPVSAIYIVSQEEHPHRFRDQQGKQNVEDQVRLLGTEEDFLITQRIRAFHTQTDSSSDWFLLDPALKQKKMEADIEYLEDKERLRILEDGTSLITATSNTFAQFQQTHSPVKGPIIATQTECSLKPVKYQQDLEEEEYEDDDHHPDPEKDDMTARWTLSFQKKSGPAFNQFLPTPASQLHSKEASKDHVRSDNKLLRLEDELQGIYGPRTSLSDDAESVSMFDMRCEDEALVQPHSKTRYERIQDVNNQLKEEEERWQDDLARWKTRRRSASQDLIKKEEERKMMEKLMCGEDGLTGRRKSIKTYREIVEEKERRERELHEAYKNARSREEADRILHRYVQRFAISEAVLERLEMPKFFERSQSVESDGSSSSPSKDSNPLKYLRQQSLPAQKFTATVETTIVSSSQPQANSPTNRTSPSKTIVSKAVPVLTPKPYSQPKSSQQSFKSFKVDGKLNVNGETSETFNGVEEKERFPAKVDPSLTRSQMFEGVASVDESRVTEQQSSMCRDTKPAGPGSPCGNKQQPESGIEKPAVSKKPVQEECDSGAELDATKKQTLKAPQDGKHLMDARNLHSSTVVTRLEFAPSKSPKEASPEHKAPADTGNIQDSSSVELVTHEAQKSKTPEQEVESLFEFLKKAPETNQGASQISPVSGEPAELHSGEVQTISVPPLNLPKRLDHWSWNPEEERKRQERWQKEQERLLQERYQREQEKLKEEWERAQKEVEEEERRYHEEERKIIEETVATFTPHSTLSSPSPTDHPSPLTPEESRNSESAALLLGGWENKQEPQKKPLQLAEAETWQIIERQKKDDQQQLPGELERETVLKKEENEHCTEKWSSKTPSYKEPLAQKQNQQDCQIPMLENSSHVKTEFQFTQDMSWNQQSLIKPPQVSQDVRKKTASLDRSWGQQPFVTEGMRRSGSHENLGTAPPYSSALQGQSPNRSVSGKKLCSTCGHPLGKGAAMIIETLSLYFHIQCFKCGICKGQLGDATTGTDVRIRNGLLNCNDCYIRSRT